jgi:hypothetical protein
VLLVLDRNEQGGDGLLRSRPDPAQGVRRLDAKGKVQTGVLQQGDQGGDPSSRPFACKAASIWSSATK